MANALQVVLVLALGLFGCGTRQEASAPAFPPSIESSLTGLSMTPQGWLALDDGKTSGQVAFTPSDQWRIATVDFSLAEDVAGSQIDLDDATALIMVPSRFGSIPVIGSFVDGRLRLKTNVDPEATTMTIFAQTVAPFLHVDSIQLEATTERIALVRMESELLSAFHGEPRYHEAYVTIPEHIEDDTPVLCIISGFVDGHAASERYNMGQTMHDLKRIDGGQELVIVRPNVGCVHGHHAMVDSEVNGPVGTAFVTEFLPHLDRYVGKSPSARTRYVTGHSSGGWTVVHLMLNHPEAFELGLSTSPDPLDFRVFHDMDIYDDQSAFVDEQGSERIFGKNYPEKTSPPTTWKMTAADPTLEFYPRQIISYEAAFGVPDADAGGAPRKLFDRSSGRLDPKTVEHWKAHDLKLKADALEASGDTEVFDRLWIVCGTDDNFLLHEGVRGFGVRGGAMNFSGRPTVKWIEGGDHWEGSQEAVDEFCAIILGAPASSASTE